jgi:hypothetical protein
MTRTERIIVLLENYVLVVSGPLDRQGDGEHLPLMNRAWNAPGYKELERLRLVMRTEQRTLYWHLASTYFWPATRRVLVCANPRCTITYPSWAKINFHQHGQRHTPLVPKVMRVTDNHVNPAIVEQAVGWLDEHWVGEPFIPDELLPVAA